MKSISPKFARTTIGSARWEWIPSSFADFMEEAEHVQAHCKELEHLVLYRGHRERKWLLDSTFVRWCQQQVFGIDPWQKVGANEFRLSTNHQQILLNLFFLKFDFLARPTDELFELENQHGIDPWFEFMKRIQQNPEEDHPHFKGSFVLDWTRKIDVAIYFATDQGLGKGHFGLLM